MSTDGTTPTGTPATGATPETDALPATDTTPGTGATPASPPATAETEQPAGGTTTGEIANDSAATEEAAPGWVARHTTTLITVMVAVIVAVAAITGLVLYRHHTDQANAATEAAFTKVVTGQGATLETVECNGGTCAAVINGAAYTVLVQKDDNGKQHFGVTDFVGN
jgi:hypothetical protein